MAAIFSALYEHQPFNYNEDKILHLAGDVYSPRNPLPQSTTIENENQMVFVGLVMFDSHIDAANQIQIEVTIGRKSGVKGLIKGKAHR